MTDKGILVSDAAREWFKNPEFVAAYDALEEEFALAEALIRARAQAEMTQGDVARAMGTTQAVIARLESGRSMPSTRTLQRFADATGTRLRIHFEKPGSTARVSAAPASAAPMSAASPSATPQTSPPVSACEEPEAPASTSATKAR